MGLIINQGKQDTSKDNQFEIILSKEELAQITKLELDPDWENTIKVTLKIIGENSKYKNRLLWDRVSFAGEFSWKYRSLRKAAGVPYLESEGVNVDIEALLLNKAVTVELTARKGNDGNDYQSIKYKVTASTPKPTVTPAPQPEAVPVEEDANPFESAPDTDDQIDW